MTERRRATLLTLAVSAAVALIVYGGTLHFDLFWDDYGALKPRTWSDLLRVWYGSWDAGPPFYRPLSTWYYALCFELFGLNGVPLHAVSIVEITAAASLVGLYARRETQSMLAGFLAAAVFAAHPGTAFSTGPFFADQFHLLALFASLGALLTWQSRRVHPSLRAWWPIAAWITVGFLIKEDTLMIGAAIVLAHGARAMWQKDLPPLRPRLCLQIAGWALALIAWRWACVSTMGRYELPSFGILAANLARGPYRILLLFPHDSSARWPVSVFLVGAAATGAWIAWRGAPGRFAGLWLIGASVFACANLPLMLVSNMTRYHLLTLGASLMTTAGAAGALALTSRTFSRRSVIGAITAGLVVMCVSSRDALADYRPCTPSNLERDRDILPWDLAPLDARVWLARKVQTCADGTYASLVDSIDVVRWHLASNRLIALVSRRAQSATVTVRVSGASPGAPATLVVSTDAGTLTRATLTSDQWVDVRAPLVPAGLSWLRRMFWLDISVTAPSPDSTSLEVGNVRIE